MIGEDNRPICFDPDAEGVWLTTSNQFCQSDESHVCKLIGSRRGNTAFVFGLSFSPYESSSDRLCQPFTQDRDDVEASRGAIG